MVNAAATVHYYYDPMCGWCFGASPLIEHLKTRQDIRLVMHPGGLFHNRALDKGTRAHFLESDQRIQSLSGVAFGPSYQSKMREADTVVLDSMLPIRAILAAEQCGFPATEMLKLIQLAHYQQGKTVHDPAVLAELAETMGIEADIWQATFTATNEQDVISASIRQMMQYQLQGYPSMMVEKQGQWQSVPVQSFFGKLDAWDSFLNRLSETD
ncbi:DsbA family protein [Photobacterium sp. GJ3]|uniref:DsbA family protein n=1 Tax=Photobacterium sp. GJ3 TaxID=2829502 RepID=UPI001B8D251F|nr:DsbA family protein [Photobacterium sp. GJ3]QUJ68592.1 DsbA family protein [Photobacterium sp. GJ3]